MSSKSAIRGIESPTFIKSAVEISGALLGLRPKLKEDDQVLCDAISDESAKVNPTTIARMAAELAKVPDDGLIESIDDHHLVDDITKKDFLSRLEQSAMQVLDSDLVQGKFENMFADIKRTLEAHGRGLKSYAEQVLAFVQKTRELSAQT